MPNRMGAALRGLLAAFHKLEAKMIPTELAAIASLVWPDWADLDDEDSNEVIAAAYRIYNAGYRLPNGHQGGGV